jgi:Zn-dependent protease
VAFQRLGKPRRDMALVAIAGPLTNVVLAVMSAALIRLAGLLPEDMASWFVQSLYQSILLNLILSIFNMFPIPPLDGSRVVMSLLPKALARQYAKLERFGLLILLGIIFLLPMLGRQMGTDLNLFRWAVAAPLQWLMPILRAIAGVSQ